MRDRQEQLDAERCDVDRRIARLTEVIENGGDASSLIARLRELEARRAVIYAELADLRPMPRLNPRVVSDRLSEWRRLLRQSTTQARAVLQRVLRGRIVFTPRPEGLVTAGYNFTCPTRFDKLFSGVVVTATKLLAEG